MPSSVGNTNLGSFPGLAVTFAIIGPVEKETCSDPTSLQGPLIDPLVFCCPVTETVYVARLVFFFFASAAGATAVPTATVRAATSTTTAPRRCRRPDDSPCPCIGPSLVCLPRGGCQSDGPRS